MGEENKNNNSLVNIELPDSVANTAGNLTNIG